MQDRNAGLTADTLFVAVTRPPMRFGVTYVAMLMNLVFTMEAFLLSKNLLTLLLSLRIYRVCGLLGARATRNFDLLVVWERPVCSAMFFLTILEGAASPAQLDSRRSPGDGGSGAVVVLGRSHSAAPRR